MKVSVIIPAYNEETVIAKNLAEIRTYLSENFSDFELILVDDGSSDSTREIAEKTDGVRVVSYPTNRGKGYAVQAGVLKATGDIIIFTDADLQYSTKYISSCAECLETADIAVGSRYMSGKHNKNYRTSRQMASRIFIWFANFMLNLGLTDIQCGIKGFESACAKRLFSRLEISGFGFDVELLALAKSENYTIREFPVVMNGPVNSNVRLFRDSLKMFFNVLALKWRLL